ncbi:SMP-30/gluconolactonase/LRE family protein [Chitinophagaceae bacterium LB-8]|uniref:SMP-30/gluconolactonase/LRE family protein n=1 Tax=Paraflavisolibacter caeni TaxID=2982496 RepID=A0A9X2XWE7_9BACT|nr:SMP-30/gluconolactonase/LRE family protein [Paraflavisolibacter caeni]MCU7549737.1 SMP-30/gluconolactonase/LRE family protein [Paraflavisolibacter caeni]
MLIQKKTINPLKGWQVDPAVINYLGKDLQRPECILTEEDGTVWSADARGGLVKMNHQGEQVIINPFKDTGSNLDTFDQKADHARYITASGSLPNGVCFDVNGDFIIANWGTNHIERMTREGKLTTLVSEIDGRPLGKTNFPLRDSKGRIWFSVTTQTEPWSDQINTRATDGYIALMDEKGARIVADGFCGTNEIRFDEMEEWLYVVESTGWKISRLRVQEDGRLTNREVYGPSQLDGFPDGFAFDAFGNLWITLIFTDVLIAITPDGEVLNILDDSNPDTKKQLFEAYHNGSVTPEILGVTKGTIAPWMASLSFGGPDLKTVYLGSLRGTNVPYFKCPVSGQKMIHWK